MFAIYEGTTGAKATAADAVAYARYLGITDFPVMADGDQGVALCATRSPWPPPAAAIHPEITTSTRQEQQAPVQLPCDSNIVVAIYDKHIDGLGQGR